MRGRPGRGKLSRVGRLPALCAALALALLGCATLDAARAYRDGTAALDRGEPERAIALLERAARQVPEASEIRNHLGLAYAAAGRHGAALAAWREAVALDCDNAAAAHNLRAAERRMLELGDEGSRQRE